MKNLEVLKNELVNFEGSIIELSNKLQTLGCEDVCEFGNWKEILNDENVIVATDEQGEEHIQIYFEVVFEAGDDEVIEATIIKINNVEKY